MDDNSTLLEVVAHSSIVAHELLSAQEARICEPGGSGQLLPLGGDWEIGLNPRAPGLELCGPTGRFGSGQHSWRLWWESRCNSSAPWIQQAFLGVCYQE